ncbi:MAG: DHHA1 domain-containing protein [Candidatus Thiodiazotropha sp.]|nr:DHHA1 domain-containing protein [Candidatus Thiodiazotropha sp.]
MQIPVPLVKRRKFDEGVFKKCREEGFGNIVSRVIAARELSDKATTIRQAIMPRLIDIEQPDSLRDIGTAVDHLISALNKGDRLCILSDFDSDGCSSSGVLFRGLSMLGFKSDNLYPMSAHRLVEGYGIGEKVVQRILDLQPRPALVLTADNGSSNADSIEWLKREEILTIVTDHHALLNGPPPAAVAVVNPIRADCEFPDKSLAGVGVAFMLLVALRKRLIEIGQLEPSVSLVRLLAFCGLGTQADCVDLGRSMTNRAMVRYSLESIQKENTYPCWSALKKLGKGDDQIIDSEFLQFSAVPAINAAGRMDVSKYASDFFITDDQHEANRLAEKLRELNDQRKTIEREMTKQAKAIAIEQHDQGRLGLVCYLTDGNPGVVGIVAARIMQMFGKPTLVASPVLGDPEHFTGSMRTTEHYSIIDGISWVQAHYPDAISRGGGHKAAGGVGGHMDRFEELEHAFDESVRAQVKDIHVLQPVIETDGFIENTEITLSLIEELRSLQPYGQGFPSPTFEADGNVRAVRMVGSPAVHAQIEIVFCHQAFKAIWFFAVEEEGAVPVDSGTRCHWVFNINENRYRGRSNLQLIIRHCECLGSKL